MPRPPHATTRPARHRRCHGNSARRDLASRRSAPSGHVATTTTTQERGSLFKWPKGPFSACHSQARGCAGPVGPLAGWHRLRLLRQIGDELVPGVEQFLLVDNVVAVEDGAALVPGQEHGNPFGDVRADQVARGSAATIVPGHGATYLVRAA